MEEAKLEDTESLILLMLKAELEDGQIKVTFSPQSTMKSKLSLKVINTPAFIFYVTWGIQIRYYNVNLMSIYED